MSAFELPSAAPTEAARRYLERGFQVIPVPYGSKRCQLQGWSTLRFGPDEVEAYFPTDTAQNVALLLGDASGDLVDIDLDSPVAVALAPSFLPPTGMISGRPGRGATHYWYVCKVASASYALRDHGGEHRDNGDGDHPETQIAMLVEIRSDKHLTLVPPSRHPAGDDYVWYREGAPAEVEPTVLRRAVATLAVAVYLAERCPLQGTRHDYWLAAAGFLLRGGLSVAETEHIISEAARGGDDEEAADRVSGVAPTAEKLKEGQPVTGGPTLVELGGDPEMPRLIAKWLEFEQAARETSAVPSNLSATELLLALAEPAELFHDGRQRTFARVPVADHLETWPVRSEGFKLWLTRAYYVQTGTAPAAAAFSAALRAIEAMALFDGDERQVHFRVARGADGAIWLDLADAEWRAVRITSDGYEVVSDPPVHFLRYRATRPLPVPVEGGSLEELRPLLNIRDEHSWRLLVGWPVAALVPNIEHAVLVLYGEPGAAKSSALRAIARLIDAADGVGRGAPRDTGELIQAAVHGWLLTMDNLSRMPEWLADDICRLVTGTGLTKRELYTDEGDIVFSARRPVALSGIPNVAYRSDLADRALLVELQAIPPRQRQRESVITTRLETAGPMLLGAVLDALAATMREEPGVELEELPRMADFAVWGTAVERALGWPAGAFMDAYTTNIRRGMEEAIANDPIAQAVLRFMEDRAEWVGTATELLNVLRRTAPEWGIDTSTRAWPSQPNQLSTRLLRAATALRVVRGLEAERGKAGANGERYLHLHWDGEPPAPLDSRAMRAIRAMPIVEAPPFKNPTYPPGDPSGGLWRFIRDEDGEPQTEEEEDAEEEGSDEA